MQVGAHPFFAAPPCLREAWLHPSPVLLIVFHFSDFRVVPPPSSSWQLCSLLYPTVGLQLLAEFTRMGAKVVFATFNRIIIATNKSSLEDAQTYVR